MKEKFELLKKNGMVSILHCWYVGFYRYAARHGVSIVVCDMDEDVYVVRIE